MDKSNWSGSLDQFTVKYESGCRILPQPFRLRRGNSGCVGVLYHITQYEFHFCDLRCTPSVPRKML